MNTKQLLRCYDALANALTDLSACTTKEAAAQIAIIRSRASGLMNALNLANSRISRETLDMCERLMDKATRAVSA